MTKSRKGTQVYDIEDIAGKLIKFLIETHISSPDLNTRHRLSEVSTDNDGRILSLVSVGL